MVKPAAALGLQNAFSTAALSAGEEIGLEALPPDWKRRALLTRSIGDTSLAAGRTPALRVPSAVSPHAFDVLLNPRLLEGMGIRILAKSRHPFDTRLFRTVRATGHP